jgi:DNA-binding beta-propeller fold protein YncE
MRVPSFISAFPSLLALAMILPAVVVAQPPTYLLQWGTFGSGVGQFLYPSGVAVDASGNVYVSDVNNNRIQKFT